MGALEAPSGMPIYMLKGTETTLCARTELLWRRVTHISSVVADWVRWLEAVHEGGESYSKHTLDGLEHRRRSWNFYGGGRKTRARFRA